MVKGPFTSKRWDREDTFCTLLVDLGCHIRQIPNDGHNYLIQWWSAVTGGAVVRAQDQRSGERRAAWVRIPPGLLSLITYF